MSRPVYAPDAFGADGPVSETYCIRRSASQLSRILASATVRLPFVFFSNMPSTSIQCLPSSRSTSRLCVTGCSIIPSAEAAFEAIDIAKFTKLAGSWASGISASANSSSSVSGSLAGWEAAVDAFAGTGSAAEVEPAPAASDFASLSLFSSADNSRGEPSALNSRRSVTLKVTCSSSIFFETPGKTHPAQTTLRFEVLRRLREILTSRFRWSQTCSNLECGDLSPLWSHDLSQQTCDKSLISRGA